MAKRRRKSEPYPGWAWMLFGLAIGLSVAFAVYVKDREPISVSLTETPPPASLQDDLSAEQPAESVAAREPQPVEKRFDFYDMLPAFEMVIADEAPSVGRDTELRAIEEPGVYMLQAGSFSAHGDADRRRAELALHGIESRVQRAVVNERNYHRVYIGPIEDLDELNTLRARLRKAQIDVLRIRLGD